MKIIVKNNDAVKAYKVLMKKLNKDGYFKEIRKNRHFISKGELKRERLKQARMKAKKELEKQEEIADNEENRILIDAKRRAREQKRLQKQSNR